MTDLETKARDILAVQCERAADRCAFDGGRLTAERLKRRASMIRAGHAEAIAVRAIMEVLNNGHQTV